MNIMDSEPVTDYITNYLCFIALSVETFIILYVKGIVKYVTVLLFVDTIVLLGGLLKAVWRKKKEEELITALQNALAEMEQRAL